MMLSESRRLINLSLFICDPTNVLHMPSVALGSLMETDCQVFGVGAKAKKQLLRCPCPLVQAKFFL